MAENPRTASAREHDDSAIIDAAVAQSDAGAVAGRGGGALQTDVGTQADLRKEVTDPDGATRAEKADDIANDQAIPSDRRGSNG